MRQGGQGIYKDLNQGPLGARLWNPELCYGTSYAKLRGFRTQNKLKTTDFLNPEE
jgi:hypothetical protein